MTKPDHAVQGWTVMFIFFDYDVAARALLMIGIGIAAVIVLSI
jgi:hypothetical protein